MPQVNLNKHAPEFTLQDYQGNLVSLSHFRGKQNVLLIFNRGFM